MEAPASFRVSSDPQSAHHFIHLVNTGKIPARLKVVSEFVEGVEFAAIHEVNATETSATIALRAQYRGNPEEGLMVRLQRLRGDIGATQTIEYTRTGLPPERIDFLDALHPWDASSHGFGVRYDGKQFSLPILRRSGTTTHLTTIIVNPSTLEIAKSMAELQSNFTLPQPPGRGY